MKSQTFPTQIEISLTFGQCLKCSIGQIVGYRNELSGDGMMILVKYLEIDIYIGASCGNNISTNSKHLII